MKQAISIPDFRNFILARFAFNFGMLIQDVITGWQVYEITHDPFSIGLIGLAEAIPFIGLALLGGVIADRFNRRNIMLYTTFVYCLCAAALTLYASYMAMGNMEYGVTPIYLIIFVSGIARGFLSPAMGSFSAMLIPRELYVNASTWNGNAFHVSVILGPAVAGLLYAFIGPQYSYLIVTVFVCLALFLFSRIPSKPKHSIERTPDTTPITAAYIWKQLSEGVKYVFGNQFLVAALALDMFAVLFGGAVSMLPVFASEILHTGPIGLGILKTAPAIGSLLMSVYLSVYPPQKYVGKLLLVCVAAFGFCFMFFAISTNFYLSYTLLALSGLFDSVSVVIRMSIVQLNAPEDMRGRVESINRMFIGSSNEIGAFESGAAARIFGLVPSVVIGSSITILVVIFTALAAPKLRNLEKLE